jgi:UDP-glucose 4-epimerase
MKIMITGVAGLMGSRLSEWILENIPDSEIIGIDNMSGGWKENLENLHTYSTRFKFYHCSLEYDYELLDSLFNSYKPDIVFHFAAYAAEGLSPFIRRYNYMNNVVSTANIITNCIKYGVRRLVFTSSLAVYGNAPAPFHESLQPNPIDPYGVAKYACELDIKIAGEQHGLDYCILRPHNVYGKNQIINDSYRNVLGIWMHNYLNDKPLLIYGSGTQTRAFSYIDDCLPCFWEAGTSPSCSREIINVGGIIEYTINEAAYMLVDVMGGGKIEYVSGRHEVKHAWCTWKKSMNLLGFKNTTELQLGMSKMWEWAKTVPNKEKFVWRNYELDVGMYPYWKQENLKS